MDQNTLLRQQILLQLEAASPVYLNFDLIKMGLQLTGGQYLNWDVQKALMYLCDKQLIEHQYHPLNRQEMRYRLTYKGQDFLDESRAR